MAAWQGLWWGPRRVWVWGKLRVAGTERGGGRKFPLALQGEGPSGAGAGQADVQGEAPSLVRADSCLPSRAKGPSAAWPVSPQGKRLPWCPFCPVPALYPGKVLPPPTPGSTAPHGRPAQCQLTAQVAGAEITAPLGSPCPLPNQWSQLQTSAPAGEDTGQLGLHRVSRETPVCSCPASQALGTSKQDGWAVHQAGSLRDPPSARLSEPVGSQGPELGTCLALHRAHGGPDPPRPQRREGEHSESRHAFLHLPPPVHGKWLPRAFGPWAPNRDFTPTGPMETTGRPLQSTASWHCPTRPSATDGEAQGPGSKGVRRGAGSVDTKGQGTGRTLC